MKMTKYVYVLSLATGAVYKLPEGNLGQLWSDNPDNWVMSNEDEYLEYLENEER